MPIVLIKVLKYDIIYLLSDINFNLIKEIIMEKGEKIPSYTSNEIKAGSWGIIIGLFLGTIITGFSYYVHVDANYLLIHKSNVGFFAFKNGKAYKLIELENR